MANSASASAANIPGGRDAAVYWATPDGKFCLFGGNGVDSAGNFGYLNDLWQFDPAKNEWTWMSGSRSLSCSPLPVSSQEICSAYSAAPAPRGWLPQPMCREAGISQLVGSTPTVVCGSMAAKGSMMLPRRGPWGIYGNSILGSALWTWVAMGARQSTRSPSSARLEKRHPQAIPGAVTVQPAGPTKGGSYGFSVGRLKTKPDSQPNDLWSFDPNTREWTWMGGNSPGPDCISTGICGDFGVYGTGWSRLSFKCSGKRMSPVTWPMIVAISGYWS